MQQLTTELKIISASTVDAQLQAIKALQDTIQHWAGDTKAPMATTDLPRHTLSTKRHRGPRVPTETPGTLPDPRVKSPPRVQPISTEYIPANYQPISQRLRSWSDPKQLEPATMTEKPVAHRTRYWTIQKNLRVQPVLSEQRKYPAKILNMTTFRRSEERRNVVMCG